MVTPINVSKLSKYYGTSKVAAVNDLSFAIESGEVYGLLGSNGAGKSTTIRIIMDFIRPTSGSVQLLGEDSQATAALRKRIGYLAGDVVLPKGVTGRALLDYLEKLDGSVDRQYKEQLIARFEAQIDKRVETLSKGNRQKIGIVQAFMHQPDILILDEPTSGLDPLMQEQFYKTVEEAKNRGAAVLLSSHSFEEVERMCKRIGIIRQGKLVYEGLVADIVATRLPRWRVTLKHASDVAKLKKSADIKVISAEKLSLTLEPSKTIEQALAALSKYPILSMTTSQHKLEDEFLSFYEDDTEAKS